MNPTGSANRGNLQVVAGGAYGTRPATNTKSATRHHETADEWLDREMKALFASWQALNGTGPYASRSIANAAQGIRHPHRILARRMREARRQHVTHERVRRIGAVLAEYADRLYAQHLDLTA